MRTFAFALLASFVFVATGCNGGGSPMPPQTQQVSAVSAAGAGNSMPVNARREKTPSQYRLIDLGANFSPSRINNKNMIAGTLGAGSTSVAAVYENGQVTPFITPQGSYSKAWDINNNGAVVGEVDSAGPCQRAALFHSNAPPTLYYMCGYGAASVATGINDSGEIVGNATPGICDQNATFFGGSTTLLDSNGVGEPVAINKSGTIAATQFDSGSGGCAGGALLPEELNPSVSIPLPPDATPPYSTAVDGGGTSSDINDSGTVVGTYLSCVSTVTGECGSVGFIYAGGKTSPVYSPGASGTMSCVQLNAVNNAGKAVGTMGTAYTYSCSFPPSARGGAILVSQLAPVDLNTLITGHKHWHLNSASDINDSGVIVGSGTKSGVTHGFMLVPRGCPLWKQLQRAHG